MGIYEKIDDPSVPTEFPAGQLEIPPVAIRVCGVEPGSADAVVEAIWGRRHFRFIAEYRRRATPRLFEAALGHVNALAKQQGLYPMVVVPYLSEERLSQLQGSRVSGIDLCGNAVLIIPEKLLIYRSGLPNRFPAAARIKNVYRGSSALAARVFLLRPSYDSVGAVQREILHRGGSLAISTVSKVLKALEEDLIIGRIDKAIRLLQPEKLLEQLAAKFERPVSLRIFTGKSDLTQIEIQRTLVNAAKAEKLRFAATGDGSAARYAVMAGEPVLSAYASNIEPLIAAAQARPDNLFPNLRLIQTDSETAFFDVRDERGFLWASPVQTYLELATGEQRMRETAEQVRSYLLHDLADQQL